MAFLSDLVGRAARVERVGAKQGMNAIEDATFEETVNQTVADMKAELNKVVSVGRGDERGRPQAGETSRPGTAYY